MNVPSFSPQPAAGSSEVSERGRFGRRVHVLDHQEIEPFQHVDGVGLVDPRMRGVRRDHPEAADFAAQDPLEDLIVGEARLARNAFHRNPENLRHFVAMLGVLEIAPAEQVRRVAEQPRAHRVALSRDRVRARARAADVSREQGEIDQRLSDANAFVALVDAHGPPDAHALSVADELRESRDGVGREPGRFGRRLERVCSRRARRIRRSRSCASR